jgi:hypothetical protein
MKITRSLTKAQQQVLFNISIGFPFCEYLTPERTSRFFRTLGENIPARLNYIITLDTAGKRVSYKTFLALFKRNLIAPSKYKESPSPQDGITQFYLTELGRQEVNRKVNFKIPIRRTE